MFKEIYGSNRRYTGNGIGDIPEQWEIYGVFLILNSSVDSLRSMELIHGYTYLIVPLFHLSPHKVFVFR